MRGMWPGLGRLRLWAAVTPYFTDDQAALIDEAAG